MFIWLIEEENDIFCNDSDFSGDVLERSNMYVCWCRFIDMVPKLSSAIMVFENVKFQIGCG